MPQSVEHHRNAVFTAHAYPFRADAYELRTILASKGFESGAGGEDNPVRQCSSRKWTRCRSPTTGLRSVCHGKNTTDSVEGSIVVSIRITVIAPLRSI